MSEGRKKNKVENMPIEALELVAKRFRVLGEPVRLRILQVLQRGEQSVTALCELLQVTQPNVSKHLKTLQEVGWLTRRQVGNTVYYAVADAVVFELCELVCGNVRESLSQQMNMLKGAPNSAPRSRHKRGETTA